MIRSKIKFFIPIVLTAALLLSCASQRPVLYPNAQLKKVGKSVAETDIDACIQLANDYGTREDSGMKVAKDT